MLSEPSSGEPLSDLPIKVSGLDRNFRFKVAASYPLAQELNACLTCGTCSAGCPVHRVFPEYDPMKMLRMIHLGMQEELFHSDYIWYCATCRTCEQRCPQGVKFFDILNVVKNLAAQAGYAPSAWISQLEQLRQTGAVFPTEDTWVARRRELSLRPLKNNGERMSRLLSEAGL
ncbi:MAG: 4Fe-4S dicluster domain-containing protein [bacterium]|nr:4Fe-4S dicluster domain-containing protein [bacterium]